MKVSKNTLQLQKTKYLGSSVENKVELEGKQRVHREFSATPKGEPMNLNMVHLREYYQGKT